MAFSLRLAKNGGFKHALTESGWADDLGPFSETYNGDVAWPDAFGFTGQYGELVRMNEIRWNDGSLSVAAPLVTVGSSDIEYGGASVSAWNSVKAAILTNINQHMVGLANFVDVMADAGPYGAIWLDVYGAKRGSITGGNGRDHITIQVDSNGGPDQYNTFIINTKGGDDFIDIKKSTIDYSATGGYNILYQESWTVVRANLGDGNNEFYSGGSRDYVIAGAGGDTVFTGGGNDIARLGSGGGVFDGGDGCDVIELAATRAQVEIALVLGGIDYGISVKSGPDTGATSVHDVEWLHLLGTNLQSGGDDVWYRLRAGDCELPPSWAKVRDIGELLMPGEIELLDGSFWHPILEVSQIARDHWAQVT